MSDNGKGSGPRPMAVTKQQFEDNHDRIFRPRGSFVFAGVSKATIELVVAEDPAKIAARAELVAAALDWRHCGGECKRTLCERCARLLRAVGRDRQYAPIKVPAVSTFGPDGCGLCGRDSHSCDCAHVPT